MLMWLTGQWKQKSSRERKRYGNGKSVKESKRTGWIN